MLLATAWATAALLTLARARSPGLATGLATGIADGLVSSNTQHAQPTNKTVMAWIADIGAAISARAALPIAETLLTPAGVTPSPRQ